MSRKYYEATNIKILNQRHPMRILTDAGFKEMLGNICQASAPADADIDIRDEYQARIEVERSFSVGCTLYINSRVVWDEKDPMLGQDDEEKWWRVNRYHLEIELSWSSTSRDLVTAAATADLYQELIRLGNHISVALREYDLALLREAPDEMVGAVKQRIEEAKKK